MSKTKFLTYAVIILVIINIITLGKLFFGNENNKRKPLPREIIIKKLHFDDSQIKSYLELIKTHRKKIDSLDNQIKSTKNELYVFLSQPENKVSKDSLFKLTANYQEQIERVHFNHFLEIKRLCRPNQLKDFDNLTKELTLIFSKKHKR